MPDDVIQEMDSRCGECGSPVRLGHEGKFLCMRDEKHGTAVALGGPGSGWHAEQGHVAAAKAHMEAAKAHSAAAETLTRDPLNLYGKEDSHILQKAAKATNAATKATQATGARPYAAQAAHAYLKMARNGKDPADSARLHAEAAKMHTSAAKWHSQVGGMRKK